MFSTYYRQDSSKILSLFQNLTDGLIIAPCDRSLSLDYLQHKIIISKAILMKLVNTFLIFLMALFFAAQQRRSR
jgi:hypothetical protein